MSARLQLGTCAGLERGMRLGLALAFGVVLTACSAQAPQVSVSSADSPSTECLGTGNARCFFRNSPVNLLPEPVKLTGSKGLFYPIAQQLEFVDGGQRTWVAPSRSLTDGASIPPLFQPIFGDPYAPEFINAAAVHDAYCGWGNENGPQYHTESWQNVHRMFYDTLIAGGTNGVKAKVMFAAVWLGGPRWNARSRAVFNPLDHVPQAARFAAMVQTKKFIEAYDPSTTQLSDYLDQTESMLLSLTPDRSSPGSAPEPAHESPRQSASATAG